ncbi:MAG: hypothetical protein ABSC91_02905 [Candidatus Bathyarchaeia archaeon]|jgi:hypothetical protein
MIFENLLTREGKDYFYIMHLSYDGDKRRTREELWDYAQKHKMIGLDLPRVVKGDWTEVREKAKAHLRSGWIRQFDAFCKKMQKGDLVMIFAGIDSVLGVAQLRESRYHYDQDLSKNVEFFDHFRLVDWRVQREYSRRLLLSEPLYGFSNTLSIVRKGSPRWSKLTGLEI